MKIFDVLIIGAGPAGLSAATYTSRAKLDTLVIEKSVPGGKLVNTRTVSNYPGSSELPGYELAHNFMNQATQFGASIINGDVVSISNLNELVKKVELSNGKVYETRSIIIATGTKPMKLEVEGYDKYFGHGVGTCLVCDAAFYRGKTIAVIGGGKSATKEALLSSNIIEKIYLINSYPTFRSDEIEFEQILKTENIEIITNTDVLSINGDENNVQSITVKNNINGEEKNIDVSGVFTYIGWNPENELAIGSGIELNEDIIKVNYLTGETNYKGVFAAGDIVEEEYRQISTATSGGTRAALSAEEYVKRQR